MLYAKYSEKYDYSLNEICECFKEICLEVDDKTFDYYYKNLNNINIYMIDEEELFALIDIYKSDLDSDLTKEVRTFIDANKPEIKEYLIRTLNFENKDLQKCIKELLDEYDKTYINITKYLTTL